MGVAVGVAPHSHGDRERNREASGDRGIADPGQGDSIRLWRRECVTRRQRLDYEARGQYAEAARADGTEIDHIAPVTKDDEMTSHVSANEPSSQRVIALEAMQSIPSDEAPLIRAAQNGDTAAFGALV